MLLPCVKVKKDVAQTEILRLKREGKIYPGYRIRKEGDFVLIPVNESMETAEFEKRKNESMKHVGSFDRVSDFFVIRERTGWESILSEIVKKQKPRAVFLDFGVQGRLRIRSLKLVYGSGPPAGIHRENGFRYYVDLNKVYFSPRLANLRKIIVDRIASSSENSLVIDMYAGVGPISIPLSRIGIKVVAIDINPDAVALLHKNARMNYANLNVILADSTSLVECFARAKHIIMNNPTQPLELTAGILKKFEKGTVVHMTTIEGSEEPLNLNGWQTLERVVVHGYSPSASLMYYLISKG
ncbi:MAG: methyltransferase [Thermoplasmatales archaeon]